MTTPEIVLASASPRRSDLLRDAGIPFTVFPSNAPEVDGDHLTGRETALVNAYRKARSVAKKHPDALVLGADTVVCLGTKLFAKPADLAEAQRMLKELQGKTHEVITGVCLMELRRHRHKLFWDVTRVTFKPLTAEEIHRYVTLVHTLDKAGAYAIQEHGDMIIEDIKGSRSNVVGLPIERLSFALQEWK